MATYKVIQDIEAEDKLVGPFSFRQFVYLLIAALLGYISFICVAKGAAFLLVLFVPPMAFFMFFAWPWSPDQPTEVWALARIRFLVKSRKRIWNQSGIKEFVTVTVPKKLERNYTDGLSQTEVRSRLTALAHTIDSRGWAVKNAFVNGSTVPPQDSDRLLDFSAMPQEVSNLDIRAEDDILDEANNPKAQQMNDMIDASSRARRQELLQKLESQGAHPAGLAPQPATKWFQRAAPATTTVEPNGSLPPVAMPSSDAAVQLPSAKPPVNSHLKTIEPQTSAPTTPAAATPAAEPAQPLSPLATEPTATAADPAILSLAHDNNLDVATLAREARKVRDIDASDDEVVVSLR
jgi:hypothetical protein